MRRCQSRKAPISATSGSGCGGRIPGSLPVEFPITFRSSFLGSGFEVAEFSVPASPQTKKPRLLPIWLALKGPAVDAWKIANFGNIAQYDIDDDPDQAMEPVEFNRDPRTLDGS